MSAITNKIDFILTFTVRNANPNGDPLNENYTRTDMQSYGEMSDVSIKRKIRNRLQDEGYEIFVQSNDRVQDGCFSLEARYKKSAEEFGKKADDQEIFDYFCKKWIDTRAFGLVITFD